MSEVLATAISAGALGWTRSVSIIVPEPVSTSASNLVAQKGAGGSCAYQHGL